MILVAAFAFGCTETPLQSCHSRCPEELCKRGRCIDADASGDTNMRVAADVGVMDVTVPVDDLGAPDAEASLDSTFLDAAIRDLGPLPGPVERERSLAWTDPAIVEDPEMISLARVMAAASDDGHGGLLFDWTLRRFGTTPFSIREDQTAMADGLKETLGDDPSNWDLTQAPFIVTAVHLRTDLAEAGHCGELRVSFSTTHATVQPFHLIFLFKMLPEPGSDNCFSYAVRLARLSEMSEQSFVVAARQLMDEHLTPDRFIIMETAEFTFFPWEWRQWTRVPNTDPETADKLPFVLENPPLFQTVDVEGLNGGGQRRQAFLAWVAQNAAAIDARRILIPEEYRAPFATAPTAFARTPLSLHGLDPAVAARYPDLRKNLEIVGCPVCHTADAEFVHTNPDRTFSEFYDKELDARAEFLDEWIQRRQKPVVPFGPLQEDPVLPD